MTDHACDWPGCTGQCHTGETCPCHPDAPRTEAGKAAVESEAPWPQSQTRTLRHILAVEAELAPRTEAPDGPLDDHDETCPMFEHPNDRTAPGCTCAPCTEAICAHPGCERGDDHMAVLRAASAVNRALSATPAPERLDTLLAEALEQGYRRGFEDARERLSATPAPERLTRWSQGYTDMEEDPEGPYVLYDDLATPAPERLDVAAVLRDPMTWAVIEDARADRIPGGWEQAADIVIERARRESGS